jgi:hypothetical protein
MSGDKDVWLIDDDDRSDMAKNLSHPDGILVEHYLPEEFVEDQQRIDLDHLPNLVLVDWQLNNTIFNRNLSVLEHIRDFSSEVPIYGFSVEEQESIPKDHRGPFDRFYKKSELDGPNDGRRLRDDISSYELIGDCAGGDLRELIELLNPSDTESDREAVRQAMPQEFYDGIPVNESHRGESIRAFADWVRDDFTQQPGLLWNRVWLSTKLGLDDEYLDEYVDVFEDDKYDRIFAQDSSERWWKSKVYDRITEIVKESDENLQGQLWQRAPEVLNVSPDHIAVCEVCSEPNPETVALNVEDSEVPVHYRCSHIEDTRKPPFEDLRVSEDAEQGGS